MWVIAGVLLGLVVLGSVVGFHSGPHTHAVAGVLGVIAAAWLLYMVAQGKSAALLWTLFGADLVVSAGMAILAWYGLSGRGTRGHLRVSLEGAEGVAVGDLSPEGIVRVRGEQWSAVSVNGPAPAGTAVQVLRAVGVHLEVWAERHELDGASPADSLAPANEKEEDE